MHHGVTVGIATKDRPEILKNCLKSIIKQSFLPDEIIIVDDGNLTENEQKELQKTINSSSRFIYIKKSKPSLSASRNLIANKSNNEIVLMLDDDTVLENDYIEKIVDVFKKDLNGKIGAVGGIIVNIRRNCLAERLLRRLFLLSTHRPFDITSTLFEERSFNPEVECEVKWLPGGITAYRKNLLTEYPLEESKEGRHGLMDLKLSLRANKEYKFVITPNAKIYHYPPPKGRESLVNIGMKHAYNRCMIYSKYGRKGFNRILFIWSLGGYITGFDLHGEICYSQREY